MKTIAFLIVAILASSLIWSQASAAGSEGPASFTVQGRILAANGTTPVQDPSVIFKVQIRSSNSSCLLFEETHTRDMSGTGGVFSLMIGEGTNTNATALTLKQIFDNSSTKTGSAGCQYVPQSGSMPTLRISYNNGHETVTFAADQRISSVPFAMSASNVQGLGRSDILQVSAQSTQAKLDSVLAQTTELLSLAGGTSTRYARTSDLPMSGGVLDLTAGGLRVSSTPATADSAVNKTYADTHVGGMNVDLASLSNGQTLVWNSSASKWTAASPTSGTVSSVTAGTGLTGGTITGSGTIALATVGTAGTYTKITTDAYGRVVSGAALSESDLPSIATAGKVSGSALTSGTIAGSVAVNTTGNIATTGNISAAAVSSSVVSAPAFRVFDASNSHKINLKAVNSLAADFDFVLPATVGANGQILSTDGNGQLSWTTPAPGLQLAADGVSTAGLAVAANDSRLSNSRAPSGAAAGDLSGSYPSPSVSKIRGVAVATTTPLNGELLRYDGSSWTPGKIGLADLKNSLGTAQIPAACAASETLNYNAVSDKLVCQTIAIAASAVSGLGSGATKNVAASGNAAATELVVGSDSRLSDSRAPNGSAGGDLGGSYPNPAVAKIQGYAVATSAPTAGQVLTWNDSQTRWEPQTLPSTTVPVTTVAGRTGAVTLSNADISGLGSAATLNIAASGDAASGEIVKGNDSRLNNSRAPNGSASGDLSGSYPSPAVAKLQGHAVATTLPTADQVLTWNDTQTRWEPKAIPAVTIPVSSVAGRTGAITLASTDISGLGTAATLNIAASGDAASGEVVKGNDSRLSNSRAPSGSAGGDLSGTYPNPVLSTTGVTAGDYAKVTVDAKGRVTAGTSLVAADIPALAWSKITSGKPTTLSGYGITDGVTSVSVTAPLTVATATSTPALALQAGTASGQGFHWSGSAWTASFANISQLRGVASALQFPTTCTTAQTLVYQTPTDTFACSDIAIASTQVSGLGTAAALNVGTTASRVVQLDSSARLPAVDGSLLTNTPLSSVQTFATNGSFVVPTGVTKIRVQAWGAGGGAGGGTTLAGGAGGAGGAYVDAIFPVTAGTSYTVTIGAAGTAGSGGAGGAGGNTTFGSLVTANGGAGGASGSTASVAGGAASSTGASVVMLSVQGGRGFGSSSLTGGAGGNPGGPGGIGSPGSGSGTTAGYDGIAPGGAGGGGGGGIPASAGGAGGAGRVIVWY